MYAYPTDTKAQVSVSLKETVGVKPNTPFDGVTCVMAADLAGL